ncbi:MAG: hypothetical protein ACJA1A_003411 [Saprospiraceae bacterium]|jgi:hypothetical protein
MVAFEWAHFGKNDGLISETVFGIEIDNEGTIWASTSKGLFDFDPEQLLTAVNPESTIRNYTYKDGLQCPEFNMGAHFKSKSGTLYFGGNNGYDYFKPSDIQNRREKPKIALSKITVRNEEVPIPEDKVLHLTWRGYSVNFEYANLNFLEAAKNEYAYQLIGVDPERIYSGARIFVNYTNLNAGRYEFLIGSTMDESNWEAQNPLLSLVVHPPP